MKAVFLEKPGGKLVVREVPVPVPGSGEVLIKMTAAPINPSDLARLKRGGFDPATYIPGLEGSGLVIAAGSGVLPKLMLGKRVACTSEYPESGTWAEYMVTKAGKCFPLSKTVDDEQGSMMMVNPLTALGFIDIVKENKHKALINNAAASALGRMVELLVNMHGIPVINLVRSEKHAEALKKTGSQFVLNSSTESFIEDLGKLSHELNATILFDSTCNRQLEKMIEVLPAGSSVVIYGNLTGEEHIFINPRKLIDNDIKISGFFLGQKAKENGLFKNIINLRTVSRLMSNNLKINIQSRFPLEKVQEAVEAYTGNMSGGKVVLRMME
jgi:NADPH:quinone reductase-like Zn-dependent oxidoreductase